ncbi:MAG: hypothetical protein ACFFB0_18065 [Promethearchaeota archaeon]
MSKDLLLDFFEKAKKKKLIDEDLISFLEDIFPEKSMAVIEVLKRGITKYIYKPSNRIVWTAMGENQEHLVYPKIYCSCQDFYKNVVVNKLRNFCKHIFAQLISEAFNNYKIVRLEDKKFSILINDFKLQI